MLRFSSMRGGRRYCKKLTLTPEWVRDSDARVRSLRILARAQARDRAEIVDEVRLVEVAAGQRDIRPIHARPAWDAAERGLEAAHAAVEFRRKAHLRGGRASMKRRSLSPVWSRTSAIVRPGAVKFAQRKTDRGMAGQRIGQPRAAEPFQQVEARVHRGRGDQALAQFAPRSGPTRRPVTTCRPCSSSAGRRRKGKAPPGRKCTPATRLLFGGIDDEKVGVRADQHAAREPLEALVVAAVVDAHFVVAEVDHQLHGAIGQQAFHLVRLRRSFVEPQKVHEAGQRPSRLPRTDTPCLRRIPASPAFGRVSS